MREKPMTNPNGPRPVLDFDKVDRACEIAVMDWLQWAEFQDEDKAQLALTMIAKRKAAYESLQAKAEKLVEALKFYADPDSWRPSKEKCYWSPISLDSDGEGYVSGNKAREALKEWEK